MISSALYCNWVHPFIINFFCEYENTDNKKLEIIKLIYQKRINNFKKKKEKVLKEFKLKN